MKQETATGLGFLLAPLVAAITAAATSFPESGSFINPLRNLELIPIFYAFALFASIIFGVPVYIIFHRKGWTTWWWACVAGAVIGSAMAFLIRLPGSPMVRDLLVFTTVGVVSALTFWGFWRLGKNDPI